VLNFALRKVLGILLSVGLLWRCIRSLLTLNRSLLTLNRSLLTLNRSLLTLNRSLLTLNRSLLTRVCLTGGDVDQKGSLCDEDKLRFSF